MTPNIAVVHVSNPEWRGFHLWIPLFLLWIPLLMLAPFLLLLLLVAALAWRISAWRAISVYWAILCGLAGTEVRVEAQGNHILVQIR